MLTLLFCLLGAVSVAHLIGTITHKPRYLVCCTKPLLMPLLAACYLLIAPKPSVWIIVGLGFATLGDIFLLSHDNRKMMMLGMASFFVMQLCYIAQFISVMGTPSTTILVLGLVCYASLYLLVGFLVFGFVPKDMRLPCAIYMLAIATMGLTSLFAFFTRYSNGMGLALLGSGLFICSDTILCMEYFKAKTRYGHTIVMLTYIAAQVCIAVGLAIGGVKL